MYKRQGMNTSNGAQAQIWNFVSGGNQEWNLERVDSTVQQTRPLPALCSLRTRSF